MTILLTLLCALLAAGDETEITAVTLDGQSHMGQLQAWNDHQLQLRQPDGQVERLPIEQLQRVDNAGRGRSQTAEPPVAVQLTDGSAFGTSHFQVTGGTARDAENREFSSTALQSVRWQDLSEAAGQQWNEIIGRSHSADVVVVQRSGGALDYVSGVLGDVTDRHVKFEFNGSSVELPRQRVVGLIYAPPSGQFPRPRFRLFTRTGERWNLEAVHVDSGQLQGQSQAGVEVRVPWDAVDRVDVLTAAYTFLSDLEPLRSSWQPYWAAADQGVEQLFSPARDTSLLGGPLTIRPPERSLDWKTYTKGLSLHSRTQLEYRLQGKFRRLTAVVGLDPRVAQPGSVKLQIWADDRSLWEGVLEGDQEGVPIELDVAGAQRLRLLVDFHKRQDLGDYLNLCDVKLWE